MKKETAENARRKITGWKLKIRCFEMNLPKKKIRKKF